MLRPRTHTLARDRQARAMLVPGDKGGHRVGRSVNPALIKLPRKEPRQVLATASKKRSLALVSATYPMRPSSVPMPANSALMFALVATQRTAPMDSPFT